MKYGKAKGDKSKKVGGRRNKGGHAQKSSMAKKPLGRKGYGTPNRK